MEWGCGLVQVNIAGESADKNSRFCHGVRVWVSLLLKHRIVMDA